MYDGLGHIHGLKYTSAISGVTTWRCNDRPCKGSIKFLADIVSFEQTETDFELTTAHSCEPNFKISNYDALVRDAKSSGRDNLMLGGKRIALEAAKAFEKECGNVAAVP